jgi:hypothetical protein
VIYFRLKKGDILYMQRTAWKQPIDCDDGQAGRSQWEPRLHLGYSGAISVSWELCERLSYVACPWMRVCHVCQVFSYKIYIDSNLWNTLGYEWSLVSLSHIIVRLVGDALLMLVMLINILWWSFTFLFTGMLSPGCKLDLLSKIKFG